MLRLPSSARLKNARGGNGLPPDIALSPSGGTSITIDIPFAEAVLSG
jgi:hypothetical protein